MNLSIYSSDWTAMNIEFKKLMLLNMRLNNAENLKLKISKTKIINLEMFTHVCLINLVFFSFFFSFYFHMFML